MLHWRDLLKNEIALFEPWLRATGKRGLTVPNPNVHSEHQWLKVVSHSKTRIVGVDLDGEVIDLPAKEVNVFSLDRVMFEDQLCAALNLLPNLDRCPSSINIRLVGFYKRMHVQHPAFLISSPDADSFNAALNQLALEQVHPFIVLASARKQSSHVLARRTSSMRVTVVMLNESVGMSSSGVLVPLGDPRHLFEPELNTVSGQTPRSDGFYSPDTVVYRGIDHTCVLTKREQLFIDEGLKQKVIPMSVVIDPVHGLLWKAKLTHSKIQRSRLSKFLSDINKKLRQASPQLRMQFNIPRENEEIHRADGIV